MFRNTSLQRECFFTSLRFRDAKKLGAVAAGTIRAVVFGNSGALARNTECYESNEILSRSS
jgi:hypothetical protein